MCEVISNEDRGKCQETLVQSLVSHIETYSVCSAKARQDMHYAEFSEEEVCCCNLVR
jgi:hypothetical protein